MTASALDHEKNGTAVYIDLPMAVHVPRTWYHFRGSCAQGTLKIFDSACQIFKIVSPAAIITNKKWVSGKTSQDISGVSIFNPT